MKFGKFMLEHMLEKWRSHYVDYKRLKKLIGRADAGSPRSASSQFTEALTAEMAKVNTFVQEIAHEINKERATLADMRSDLSIARASEGSLIQSNGTAQIVAKKAEIWQLTKDLTDFVELNYRAIYKIAKKFDKRFGTHHMDSILESAEAQPWMHVLSAQGMLPGVPKEDGKAIEIQGPHAARFGVETDSRTPRIGAERLSPTRGKPMFERVMPTTAFKQPDTPVPIRRGLSMPLPPDNLFAPKTNVDAFVSLEPDITLETKPWPTAIAFPNPETARLLPSTKEGEPPKAETSRGLSLGMHLPLPPAIRISSQPSSARTRLHPDDNIGLQLSPRECALLSPTSNDGKGPAGWNEFDPTAAELLSNFVKHSTETARSFVQGGLQALIPDLASDSAEAVNALQKADNSLVLSLALLQEQVNASAPMQRVVQASLAANLRFFRYLLGTVSKSLELVHPEGAAVVESAVQAFVELFGLFMGYDGTLRLNQATYQRKLLARLQKPALRKTRSQPHMAQPAGMRRRASSAGSNASLATIVSTTNVREDANLESLDDIFLVTDLHALSKVLARQQDSWQKPGPRRVSSIAASIPGLPSPINATGLRAQESEQAMHPAEVKSRLERGNSGTSDADRIWLAAIHPRRTAERSIPRWITSVVLPHRKASRREGDQAGTQYHVDTSERDAQGRLLPENRRRFIWHGEVSELPLQQSQPERPKVRDHQIDVVIDSKLNCLPCCALATVEDHIVPKKVPTLPTLTTPPSFSGRKCIHSIMSFLTLLVSALSAVELYLFPADSSMANTKNDMIPPLWQRAKPSIFEWLPAYNWKKNFMHDLIAGVTIGIFLLPQGLAYATLVSLPPVYGIYTGFPAALYALLGTSRQAAIGPQSIPALLIASGVDSMGPLTADQKVAAVMGITFMAGAFMFLLGVLNMGFFIRFISRPVLSGFISASAILTIAASAKDFLGAPVPRSQVINDYIYYIAINLPNSNWPTILTGVFGLVGMTLYQKFRIAKFMPPALLAMTCFIIVFVIWMKVANLAGSSPAGIQLVGSIPSGFPTPTFPSFTGLPLGPMFTTALTVVLVGFMESIAVAKMYGVKYGYEVSPSSELKAIGMVNLLGSIFGSFLIMGAFGRSALNDRTGARTPMTQIISTIVVLVLLSFITPAIYFLPKTILAAIIFMSVAQLIDISGARRLWRIDLRDFATMSAALLATLFLGVLYGVIAAMGFSLVIFIAVTTQPKVEELGRLSETVTYWHIGMVGVSRVPGVKIIKFLAPLFFANCSVLRDRMLKELVERRHLPPKLRWHAAVLCFASVASIDTTALEVLEEIIHECHQQQVMVLIATANAYVEATFQESGILGKLGGANFRYNRVHDAVRAVLLHQVTASDLPREAGRLDPKVRQRHQHAKALKVVLDKEYPHSCGAFCQTVETNTTLPVYADSEPPMPAASLYAVFCNRRFLRLRSYHKSTSRP